MPLKKGSLTRKLRLTKRFKREAEELVKACNLEVSQVTCPLQDPVRHNALWQMPQPRLRRYRCRHSFPANGRTASSQSPALRSPSTADPCALPSQQGTDRAIELPKDSFACRPSIPRGRLDQSVVTDSDYSIVWEWRGSSVEDVNDKFWRERWETHGSSKSS